MIFVHTAKHKKTVRKKCSDKIDQTNIPNINGTCYNRKTENKDALQNIFNKYAKELYFFSLMKGRQLRTDLFRKVNSVCFSF